MADVSKHVVIVGGGLVGALNACYFAQRGFTVELYEKRPDIRLEEHVKGRSINLALSHRGRSALRKVGLEDLVTSTGIPMYARMIHNTDGSRRPIPYGKKDQYIMSIDRRLLNEKLLTAAEENPNVKIHFSQKLVSCNVETGELVFMGPDNRQSLIKSDLIVGNDGAYSQVRQQLMKSTRFDYSQEYIPHGYMELTMHSTKDGKYAMEKNFLHIWPRNTYMMIALPNADASYTVTMFMTFQQFEAIQSERQLMNFFKETFPDALDLLGEDYLIDTFFKSKALPMVSVKCSPYDYGGRIVLMGDACHAMVPFYGQGMNAGFEDCLIFHEILDQYNNDLTKALPAFTAYRNIDAKAICDLAMYNYIEMRESVNSRLFLLRKKLDNFLHFLMPNTWVPLYTMVSFTRTRYSECISRRKWQDMVLNRALIATCVVGGLVISKTVNMEKISNFGNSVLDAVSSRVFQPLLKFAKMD